MADILQSYNLNWNQAVSVLLDNCGVMREKLSGVETQIREENLLLLDISKDTVHIVLNAARTLLSPFKVYYDTEEFQSLLHIEKKSLIHPTPRRPFMWCRPSTT